MGLYLFCKTTSSIGSFMETDYQEIQGHQKT